MTTKTERPPKIPPSWFVHLAWKVHRALHRLSGGRFLWTPASKRGWGALRLTTTGRRTGEPRNVIVGYLDEGDDLLLLAMNGWQDGHPSWWLNLQAHPEAVVQLAHQPPRKVRAREATGEERPRLWQRWTEVDGDLDSIVARRTPEPAVLLLEPIADDVATED